MMRSLYSGVSGLKTHQTKMDVIGNNIANVNTVAYKSQSITFSELMYQTTQAASGPNATTGTAGKNAKQIGLGVTSGAISTAITQQGSTQTTGNAFDLKITGESFFVVSDGSTNFFTRDGSFYVDAAGNLAMSSTGYNVMGWEAVEDKQTEEINIVQDTVKKLQILSPDNLTSPPQATTKATISGILDKNDVQVKSPTGKAVNLSFYDNLGYSYTAKFNAFDTDDEGEYIFKLTDVLDANNDSVLDKFDASIFTGTDEAGTPTNATKKAAYSVMDGYTLDATTGKVTLPSAKTIKYKDGTSEDISEISVGDFLNSDGSLKDGEKAQLVADLYASSFGFDSWTDMGNLTVDVADSVDNVTHTAISVILGSGNLTYSGLNDDGTDVTNKNLFSDEGVLNVDGYATPAGKSVKIKYDQAKGKFAGINGSTKVQAFNLTLKPKNEGSDNPFEQISVDMSSSLNQNNEATSTMTAKSGDKNKAGTGCALGAMTGVSIQNNGMIYGAYDNGQTKLLGQIAVANFSNAMGLEKEGDNLYKATLNSGEFDGIGIDITSDGGYMSTGVLEMSNVDLSSEFTELITTQRGFQANSRIITVSDTLLEELVNLKR